MKTAGSLSKIIASVLSVSLFCTQALLAYTPETQLLKERQALRQPSISFAGIPAQFGTIRKITRDGGKSKGTVIVIQDIHQNNEAQTNIAKTIQTLVDQKKVDAIALEGAFGPIDISRFQKYSDQRVVRSVADYLFREGKMSGPVYSAMINPSLTTPIIGIDDNVHYQANVEAVRNSEKVREQMSKDLSEQRKTLAIKKSQTFNPALAAFDSRVEGYRDGKMPLPEYLKALNPEDHPLAQISLFQEALQLESSLDFKKVEAERSRLVEKLSAKLSAAESQNLLNLTVAFRLGQINHADFYSTLKTLCANKGLQLSAMPSLNSYIQYVLLVETIDMEQVMREIRQWEEKTYQSLIQNDQEKALIAESRRQYLLEKLSRFELTREEWDEYKSVPSASFLVPSAFEDFYTQAEIRDEMMAKNLLGTKHQALGTIILVVGGFHTAGISKHLSEAGYEVAVFTPRLTKDAESGSYLSVFTQEKTPLEKLVRGEKLFLATPPVPEPPYAEMLVGGVNEALTPGEMPKTQNHREISSLIPDGSPQLSFDAVDQAGRKVTVVAQSRNGTVQLPVEVAPDGSIRSVGKYETASNSFEVQKQEFIRELSDFVQAEMKKSGQSEMEDSFGSTAPHQRFLIYQEAVQKTLEWMKGASQSSAINIPEDEYRRLLNGMAILGYGGLGRKIFYGLSSDIDWIFIFPPTTMSAESLEAIKEDFFDIVKQAVPNNMKRDIHPISQLSELEYKFQTGTFTVMDAAILAHVGWVAGDKGLFNEYQRIVRSAFANNVSYSDIHLMNYFIRRQFHQVFPVDMVDFKRMAGGFTEIAFLYQFASEDSGFVEMSYSEALQYLEEHGVVDSDDVRRVTEMLRLLNKVRLKHNRIRIPYEVWERTLEGMGISLKQFESKKKAFLQVVHKVERAFLKKHMDLSAQEADSLLSRNWDSPAEFRKANNYSQDNWRLDNFILWRTNDRSFLRAAYERLQERNTNDPFTPQEWMDLLAVCGNEETPGDILADIAAKEQKPIYREQLGLIAINPNSPTSTLIHIARSPYIKSPYRGHAVDALYKKLIRFSPNGRRDLAPLPQMPAGITDPDESMRIFEELFEDLPEESLKDAARNRIRTNLNDLYGSESGEPAYTQILSTIKEVEDFQEEDTSLPLSSLYDQHDAQLITYADSLLSNMGISHLRALARFAARHLSGVFNRIHILPFYTWDTDRGFSVLNYEEVDPRFGDWSDIEALNNDFKLAFDLVAGHASIDNPWVQAALISTGLSTGDPRRTKYEKYEGLVITYSNEQKPSDEQMAKVIHIRTTGLLSKYYVVNDGQGLRAVFDLPQNEKDVIYDGWVWTTFKRPTTPDGLVGTKQVDFNYMNPLTVVHMCRVIRFYVEQGVSMFRIDSAPTLWKEPGKYSLHEPQTRKILQIFQDAMFLMNPQILSLVEIKDEPATEIGYLGNEDQRGADLIYQFSSFPMMIYTLLKGDAKYFREWVPRVAGANGRQLLLLGGSHDGFTLRPLEGPLDGSAPLFPAQERQWMIEKLVDGHNAIPGYRKIDGKDVIRELVITPWNAINPENSQDPLSLQVDRYIAFLALGLGIRGIPNLYINGYLAPSMKLDNLAEPRESNRQGINEGDVDRDMSDENSRMSQVARRINHLLTLRSKEKAMDPRGPPEIVVNSGNDQVVSVLLKSADPAESILSCVNIAAQRQTITLNLEELGIDKYRLYDLLGKPLEQSQEKTLVIELEPYQVLWLRHSAENEVSRRFNFPMGFATGGVLGNFTFGRLYDWLQQPHIRYINYAASFEHLKFFWGPLIQSFVLKTLLIGIPMIIVFIFTDNFTWRLIVTTGFGMLGSLIYASPLIHPDVYYGHQTKPGIKPNGTPATQADYFDALGHLYQYDFVETIIFACLCALGLWTFPYEGVPAIIKGLVWGWSGVFAFHSARNVFGHYFGKVIGLATVEPAGIVWLDSGMSIGVEEGIHDEIMHDRYTLKLLQMIEGMGYSIGAIFSKSPYQKGPLVYNVDEQTRFDFRGMGVEMDRIPGRAILLVIPLEHLRDEPEDFMNTLRSALLQAVLCGMGRTSENVKTNLETRIEDFNERHFQLWQALRMFDEIRLSLELDFPEIADAIADLKHWKAPIHEDVRLWYVISRLLLRAYPASGIPFPYELWDRIEPQFATLLPAERASMDLFVDRLVRAAEPSTLGSAPAWHDTEVFKALADEQKKFRWERVIPPGPLDLVPEGQGDIDIKLLTSMRKETVSWISLMLQRIPPLPGLIRDITRSGALYLKLTQEEDVFVGMNGNKGAYMKFPLSIAADPKAFFTEFILGVCTLKYFSSLPEIRKQKVEIEKYSQSFPEEKKDRFLAFYNLLIKAHVILSLAKDNQPELLRASRRALRSQIVLGKDRFAEHMSALSEGIIHQTLEAAKLNLPAGLEPEDPHKKEFTEKVRPPLQEALKVLAANHDNKIWHQPSIFLSLWERFDRDLDNIGVNPPGLTQGMANGGEIGKYFGWIYREMRLNGVPLGHIQVFWGPLLQSLFFQFFITGVPTLIAFFWGIPPGKVILIYFILNLLSTVLYASDITHKSFYLGASPYVGIRPDGEPISPKEERTYRFQLGVRSQFENMIFFYWMSTGLMLSRIHGWPIVITMVLLGLASVILFHGVLNYIGRRWNGLIGLAPMEPFKMVTWVGNDISQDEREQVEEAIFGFEDIRDLYDIVRDQEYKLLITYDKSGREYSRAYRIDPAVKAQLIAEGMKKEEIPEKGVLLVLPAGSIRNEIDRGGLPLFLLRRMFDAALCSMERMTGQGEDVLKLVMKPYEPSPIPLQLFDTLMVFEKLRLGLIYNLPNVEKFILKILPLRDDSYPNLRFWYIMNQLILNAYASAGKPYPVDAWESMALRFVDLSKQERVAMSAVAEKLYEATWTSSGDPRMNTPLWQYPQKFAQMINLLLLAVEGKSPVAPPPSFADKLRKSFMIELIHESMDSDRIGRFFMLIRATAELSQIITLIAKTQSAVYFMFEEKPAARLFRSYRMDQKRREDLRARGVKVIAAGDSSVVVYLHPQLGTAFDPDMAVQLALGSLVDVALTATGRLSDLVREKIFRGFENHPDILTAEKFYMAFELYEHVHFTLHHRLHTLYEIYMSKVLRQVRESEDKVEAYVLARIILNAHPACAYPFPDEAWESIASEFSDISLETRERLDQAALDIAQSLDGFNDEETVPWHDPATFERLFLDYMVAVRGPPGSSDSSTSANPLGIANGGAIGKPLHAFYQWLMNYVSFEQVALIWGPLTETIVFQLIILSVPLTIAFIFINNEDWFTFLNWVLIVLVAILYASPITHKTFYEGENEVPGFDSDGDPLNENDIHTYRIYAGIHGIIHNSIFSHFLVQSFAGYMDGNWNYLLQNIACGILFTFGVHSVGNFLARIHDAASGVAAVPPSEPLWLDQALDFDSQTEINNQLLVDYYAVQLLGMLDRMGYSVGIVIDGSPHVLRAKIYRADDKIRLYYGSFGVDMDRLPEPGILLVLPYRMFKDGIGGMAPKLRTILVDAVLCAQGRSSDNVKDLVETFSYTRAHDLRLALIRFERVRFAIQNGFFGLAEEWVAQKPSDINTDIDLKFWYIIHRFLLRGYIRAGFPYPQEVWNKLAPTYQGLVAEERARLDWFAATLVHATEPSHEGSSPLWHDPLAFKELCDAFEEYIQDGPNQSQSSITTLLFDVGSVTINFLGGISPSLREAILQIVHQHPEIKAMLSELTSPEAPLEIYMSNDPLIVWENSPSGGYFMSVPENLDQIPERLSSQFIFAVSSRYYFLRSRVVRSRWPEIDKFVDKLPESQKSQFLGYLNLLIRADVISQMASNNQMDLLKGSNEAIRSRPMLSLPINPREEGIALKIAALADALPAMIAQDAKLELPSELTLENDYFSALSQNIRGFFRESLLAVITSNPGQHLWHEPDVLISLWKKFRLNVDKSIPPKDNSIGAEAEGLVKEQRFFAAVGLSVLLVIIMCTPSIDHDVLCLSALGLLMFPFVVYFLMKEYQVIHQPLIESRSDIFTKNYGDEAYAERVNSYKEYIRHRFFVFSFIALIPYFAAIAFNDLSPVGTLVLIFSVFATGQVLSFGAHWANNIWWRWNREEGKERSLGANASVISNEEKLAWQVAEAFIVNLIHAEHPTTSAMTINNILGTTDVGLGVGWRTKLMPTDRFDREKFKKALEARFKGLRIEDAPREAQDEAAYRTFSVKESASIDADIPRDEDASLMVLPLSQAKDEQDFKLSESNLELAEALLKRMAKHPEGRGRLLIFSSSQKLAEKLNSEQVLLNISVNRCRIYGPRHIFADNLGTLELFSGGPLSLAEMSRWISALAPEFIEETKETDLFLPYNLEVEFDADPNTLFYRAVIHQMLDHTLRSFLMGYEEGLGAKILRDVLSKINA